MTTPGQVESISQPSTTLENRARALKDIRTRDALFNGLLSRDPQKRLTGLNNITQFVKNWAKECYPPKPLETAGTVPETPRGGDGNESGVSSPLNNYNSSKRSSISDGNNTLYSPLFNTDGSGSASVSSYATSPVIDLPDENGEPKEEPEEKKKLRSQEYLRLMILTILRMSVDCPFADVRNTFKKFLNKLRASEVPVPIPICPFPSSYIAPEEILTLEWTSEYISNALDVPHSGTPAGQTSPCSSLSSNSSSFFEEIPRIIQQPLTPMTPLFINPPDLPTSKQPDELVKNLMVNTFIKLGRLSHFYRVLAYFPSFMEKYQDSYNTIVRAPTGGPGGPVPASWRFYIGMMAASQHKCRYIVSKLTDDFLIHGGDTDWLQGLQHTPTKIRKLARLNTILAHQPWRLQPSDIHELARGSQNPQDNWAIPEIVHVIVILSTFHSLSSFVLGCGIVPEYDSIGGNIFEQSSIEEPESCYGIMDSSNGISPAMASGLGVSIVQEQSEEPKTETTAIEKSEEPKTETIAIETSKPIDIPKTPSSLAQKETDDIESLKHTTQLIKRLKAIYGSLPSEPIDNDFENVEQETFTSELAKDELPFPLENLSTKTADSPTIELISEEFSRFLDKDLEIQYEDFDTNSSDYEIFQLQDYSWETQGIAMVNIYLQDGGELLNKEFSEVHELTDYRLFHSYKSSDIDLDTKPLRQAVWFYILRLYGLRKDDYEYRDINTFLNKKIKMFLKKVCCTPEKIIHKDWRNVGFQLREEEKCHINLIAVEARKQAELIYGLSNVMKWEKNKPK